MFNAYDNGNQCNASYRQNNRMPTKAEQLQFLASSFNASVVERVTEFDSNSTKHACIKERTIFNLGIIIKPIPTPKGTINAECMFCSYCRKLIVNSSSLA